MVDFQERDTRRSIGDGTAADADEENPTDESVARTNATDECADDGSDDDRGDAHPDGHTDEHGHHHDDPESVTAAVLTISSSRTVDDDASGDAIVESLEAAGHEVATRELVNDDYDGVQGAVDALVKRGDVETVIATGGTGVAPEDVTPEAVRPLLDKELPGFGEQFRALSAEEIGTRAIATRATAGVADGVPVFCLPGSVDAARLGTTEVVVPVIGHLVGLARPHETEE